MNLRTNLAGRLRNTDLQASQGLLPLFEAVVNSMQAIEEAGKTTSQGTVTVAILREPQGLFASSNAELPITGFRIVDNGIGFTDANMDSFCDLDSDYKIARGGRGVGRLVWLKAFKTVRVSSVFSVGDERKHRTFTFKTSTGITEHKLVDAGDEPISTTVTLEGFGAEYQMGAPKTSEAIANALFEHALWNFLRPGGAPTILLEDGEKRISLDNVCDEHMHSSAETEAIVINKQTFQLAHIKLRAGGTRKHALAYCAATRLVKLEALTGRMPGFQSPFTDGRGPFVYACYVTSAFLDERVRSERTDFNITTEPSGLFSKEDIGWDAIRKATVERAAAHLASHLESNRARVKERVESFVAHRAPRYRSILPRLSARTLELDPEISDKDLELKLHSELAVVEGELLAQGQALMSPQPQDGVAEYRAKLDAYLKTAEDIKKSDLANYLFHRRIVLDLFRRAIERKDDGKYNNEDIIHRLIMPMRTDSDSVQADECNLWLVDESLAFHHYLASDRPLSSMPVLSSNSGKEPDIFALNLFDNPVLVSEHDRLPQASIVVVEIKKPLRNDAAPGEIKDPIEQALGYLRRIREGKVQTRSGRPIPNAMDIPGFCYVLCDLTASVRERCEFHNAQRTADGLGYFLYHDSYKAYVEISSFDRIVNNATQRHRAFFDKLGLPSV